jgi:hypothetical protein
VQIGELLLKLKVIIDGSVGQAQAILKEFTATAEKSTEATEELGEAVEETREQFEDTGDQAEETTESDDASGKSEKKASGFCVLRGFSLDENDAGVVSFNKLLTLSG